MFVKYTTNTRLINLFDHNVLWKGYSKNLAEYLTIQHTLVVLQVNHLKGL